VAAILTVGIERHFWFCLIRAGCFFILGSTSAYWLVVKIKESIA